MRGIFSYLKLFENKISEHSEKEFLDINKFKSTDFNLTNYIKLVISKLDDTNVLVSSLKNIKDSLSDEIVHQINSNFNNYMVLISKMQAIDFLVDNIVKPLKNIKYYINEQYSLIDRYEKELNHLKVFEAQNEAEINTVRLTLRFHKNLESVNKLAMFINNSYENKFGSLNEQNFETKRKILTEFYKFFSKISVCEEILKTIKNDRLSDDIKILESTKLKYLEAIDELIKVNLSLNSNELEGKNIDNLLYLCLKNIEVSSSQERLYQMLLYKGGFCVLIEELWKKYKNLNTTNNKLEDFLNLTEENFRTKFGFVINVIRDYRLKYNVEEFCVVKILLKLFVDEKEIFNCVDPISFKDNYYFLSNFFRKIIKSKKVSSATLNSLKQFFNKFSYFTYYQFLQNDIQKVFFDDFLKTKQLTNDQNGLINTLTCTSNLMFSFAKIIQEYFIERKILLKILPNFLKYHCQSQKYIIKKIELAINNTSVFPDKESLKEKLVEFKASFSKFYTFFEENFFKSIEKIVEEEGVLFEEKSLNELKESLRKFQVAFIENLTVKKLEIERI